MSRRQRDFVVVGQPAETRPTPGLSRRAPIALAWLLGMLILMTFEIVPTVIAVLLAAFAMVVTGCLPVGQVYRRINWESVVLIAGMIPMATALDTTGGLAFISGGLVDTLGNYGPLAMLLGLFLLTSLFSQFISNTATSLLVAPIGIQVAATLDISPYPLLMGIAIAASTAFSTPVASPTNTLVLDPGGYRFVDYARLGIPLQLLLMVATLLAVPWLFPF
jgi:di/tricarboxylate transporter